MPGQIISKAVGIDLGTTNSAVALLDPTDTKIITHQDANTRAETTPSCVWKNPKTGEVVVGRQAVRRIGTMPQPVRSVKRLMGTQNRVRLTDEDLLPEEISAAILAEMKRQIEQDVAALGSDGVSWEVDRAIVTVPAHFDQPNIEATQVAAEMAGLTVLDLLHEPTAAACYHCWRTGTENGLFLVYDLGGGTFNVSILRCRAGVFEVLGISGNTRLGGDDLDTIVAEDLRERLIRDGWSFDLDSKNDEEDALRWALLRRVAESVKIGLSNSGEYLLQDWMGLRDKEGERIDAVEVLYLRSELEALVRPLIERTIPYCFDALVQAEDKAGVKLGDVDAIVLAGGSTHVPLVRDIVRQNLCTDDGDGVSPADERANQPRARCAAPVYEGVDSIVARGAAIRAAATGGLAICNAERTVRIFFRGMGATGAKETHMGGNVEALSPDLDLTGCAVRLTIADLDYEVEEDLGEGGAFAFKRVPLQPSADNVFTFEVLDSSGDVLATAGRAIKQSEEVKPSGGSDGSAVLAKAILLEVMKDGKVQRDTLVPALQTLPFQADFSFLHPGDTEVVRIAIFQHKRRIKEIPVQVPSSLPRGTPITLNVHVDHLAFITVKGTIGSTEFECAVEVPAARQMPTDEEARSVEKQFVESAAYLPAGQKSVQAKKFEKAKGAYDDAVQRGDDAGALHEFEEMEDIAAGAAEVEGPLSPPKAGFDDLVKECFELVRYAQTLPAQGEPLDAAEMTKSIEAQREEGEAAFRDSEQQKYTTAIQMLTRIRDHVVDYCQRVEPPTPPPKPEEEAARLIAYAQKQAAELKAIAAGDRPDLVPEINDVETRLRALEQSVGSDPQGAMQGARQQLTHLSRIKTVLQGGGGPAGDLPEAQ